MKQLAQSRVRWHLPKQRGPEFRKNPRPQPECSGATIQILMRIIARSTPSESVRHRLFFRHSRAGKEGNSTRGRLNRDWWHRSGIPDRRAAKPAPSIERLAGERGSVTGQCSEGDLAKLGPLTTQGD